MDFDVEMVDTTGRAAKGGIVPTEDDFENGGDETRHTHVRRQNNCFFFLLISFTLAMLIFVVGTVYLGPGENNLVIVNEFTPDSGTVGSDAKEKMKEAFASEATSNTHETSAALENWMKDHGFGSNAEFAAAKPGNHNVTKLHSPGKIHGHTVKPTHTGNRTSSPGFHNVVASHAHSGSVGQTSSQTSTSGQTTQDPNTSGGVTQNTGTASGTASGTVSGTGEDAKSGGTGEDTQSGGDTTKISDSTGETAKTTPQDVTAWLNAPVTLGDGIMYEIVEQIHHDNKAFTEGLAYSNGVFYESTGLNGQSSIRTLNPLTGEKIQSYPIDSQYFGEGLTAVDDKLIQLTYQKQVGFVYDAADLTKTPDTFTFSSTLNEGWGLTYDAERKELIMSDGSHYLHFWDPHTFQELRKVPIMRQDGKNARSINELEYWRGRVLANVWYQDVILVINPATGVVEKEYDFSKLWPQNVRRKAHADVLNGISISEDPDILYFTGKNWDRMFRIRLLI